MDDREALFDGLENSIPIISAFVQSVSKEDLDRRRKPDIWTVAEHVRHLADVQPMLCKRIMAFQEEEAPRFAPFFPGDDEPSFDRIKVDVDAALDAFATWRGKQLLLLRSMAPIAWEKRGEHPEYRAYTLPILTRHILMHDHWHMYRMEELWLTRDAFFSG
ncbi:MAG: DinB family protein [Desulfobacterales bacterium]|jgi:hypothetical protein